MASIEARIRVIVAMQVATAALQALQEALADLENEDANVSETDAATIEAQLTMARSLSVASQHIWAGDIDSERELEEPNPYHGTAERDD